MDAEDNFEYYEYENDEFNDYGFDDDFDLEESIDSTATNYEPAMEYLNNVDYALNSPLLVDEIHAFLEFLLSSKLDPKWNANLFNKRKSIFSSFINARECLFHFNPHKWMGALFLNKNLIISDIKLFMSRVKLDTDETMVIPNAFMQSWLNKVPDYVDKTELHDHILNWGQLFIEFHKITLVANISNLKELKELESTYVDVTVLDEALLSAKFASPNLGCIVIGQGLIYVQNSSLLLTRNFLLMLKDTVAARFQSLATLTNRLDNKYDGSFWTELLDFYSAGDLLLSDLGNDAYELIKLVEPTCNLRLVQLAQEYRPLIPIFGTFEHHVATSILDVKSKHNITTNLFDMILSEGSVEHVLTYYGSFRHWGHPFIDSLEGLRKLYDQVTCPKQIDKEYAEILASDLTYIVLRDQFKLKNKWMVDIKRLDKKHMLYHLIKTNVWPTPVMIENFGNKWHLLPLTPCFEIPDMIDPSIIYSDKSHSMNRSEIITHLEKFPGLPIPTCRVLKTLLIKPSTNWKEFLQQINDHGLDIESLVIGLKEKEREIKINGRFFSLMSWELRDYFVITEYLIKKHFVSLFYGLTMADDLTTVVRKMMETTSGQGASDYEYISIANHIDYEKWNNHQRKESTYPVFKVMGQFLGYPELIARTHEMFERSFIYHPQHADKMGTDGFSIFNTTENRVCWNGQAGGLEGLRQKGWSILNLLVIRREGDTRNTKIKCLAQGDNQVICTQYKMQKYRTIEELSVNISNIIKNNNFILESIEKGTKKLGLIINRDETMQSADYLNYGKVPVFRGNVRNLETKRWSRVTCVTNDQIPNISNIMATVSTNALTVAHFSEGPINTIYHFNFLANFVRLLLEDHNPAIRSKVNTVLKNPELLKKRGYKIALAYLDPSLGGVSGMSLTRFMMRQFPDPITESLTFLKMVYNGSEDEDLKNMVCQMGQPKFKDVKPMDFRKLLEDPLSLNIPRGIDALTVLKERIKENLIQTVDQIQNKMIQDAVIHVRNEEESLVVFLSSIRPVFSRFISEYFSATFIGITNSLIGLFQNSRTIRNAFSKKLAKSIDAIIIKSEIISYVTLLRYSRHIPEYAIWGCSAHHADFLRRESWGEPIIGATIPHPAELMNIHERVCGDCTLCFRLQQFGLYISLIIPTGLIDCINSRGPYPAYLGSKTNESTSILQSWERDCNIPFIERASRLRKAIGWMVDADSNLADTIYQNLEAMTGESWDRVVAGFRRTGSALHRFSCSRQSSGGFTAQSPVKLTRMVTTTSTLKEIGSTNYDFMFQSCILYAQMTAGELHDQDPRQGYYHFHIGCTQCLREIEESTLTTTAIYKHPDVSEILSKWKPINVPWSTRRQLPALSKGDWSSLDRSKQSFHIGRTEGFLFGDRANGNKSSIMEGSLFPLNLANKVDVEPYMEGILVGLMTAASLSVVFKWSIHTLKNPKSALIGAVLYLIERLSLDPAMQGIWRNIRFLNLFLTVPHKHPPSFPMKEHDLGESGRNYLETLLLYRFIPGNYKISQQGKFWIFSDVHDTKNVGLIGLSQTLFQKLYIEVMNQKLATEVRKAQEVIINLRDENSSLDENLIMDLTRHLLYTEREVRHAAKDLTDVPIVDQELGGPNNWEEETVCRIYDYQVNFEEVSQKIPLVVPRIQNPLISGLRLFQCATGSHYKLRAIIRQIPIRVKDILCGGDGSGGISSALLRMHQNSKLIFNSLLDFADVNLRGADPAPPTAIFMVPHIINRCVNLYDAWRHPNDLSSSDCWEYFKDLKRKHNMHINLMVFDMEVQSSEMSDAIEDKILQYHSELLSKNGTLIYKSYIDRLYNKSPSFIELIGKYFSKMSVCYTQLTSSSSSEVYLICRGRRESPFLVNHLDWERLRTDFLGFPVFQTEADEFKRAVSIKHMNLLIGVPSNYLTDLYLDATNLFMSLGVETGLSYQISTMMNTNRTDKTYSTALAGMLLGLNSIINITGGSPDAKRPPSDSQVKSTGVLIVGFQLWLSYVFGNSRDCSFALKMISSSFSFSWMSERKVDGKYYNKWSISETLMVTKNLYLDDKMAQIGQVIRVLRKIFQPTLNGCTTDQIDKKCKKLNSGLTLRQFERQTQLMQSIGKSTYVKMTATDNSGYEVHRRNIPHWMGD